MRGEDAESRRWCYLIESLANRSRSKRYQEHTIDRARHGQQLFFGDFISLEISSHLSLIHGCLIDAKCTIFPFQSLPFGSCTCHLDHDISFDILDIKAPLGDSALKLLFPKKFSASSSLGHAGPTYEAMKP
jgi:hypothetical protein